MSHWLKNVSVGFIYSRKEREIKYTRNKNLKAFPTVMFSVQKPTLIIVFVVNCTELSESMFVESLILLGTLPADSHLNIPSSQQREADTPRM